jgi:hypothetical protein
MNREDWILLALHLAGNQGLSALQLQKSLFLLRMEVPEVGGDFYEFIPHNYGPFCKQIYVDAERLASRGMVAIEREQQSFATFYMTGAGEQRVADIQREASPRALEYLAGVIRWARRQTFSGLVRAIYEKYPAFRVNSVFK